MIKDKKYKIKIKIKEKGAIKIVPFSFALF